MFFLRNKLIKTEDGAYVINLNEYKLIGTNWIDLYVNGGNVSIYLNYALIALKLNIFLNKLKTL